MVFENQINIGLQPRKKIITAKMKEQIKEILNQNGYSLTDETTLLEMAEIINRHKKIMELLEEAMIDIPQKRKTLEL